MNKKEWNKIIEKYDLLGMKDFKLRNLQDLKEIYNVNLDKIIGYKDLVANKSMFERFILHFYNSIGLESRLAVKPISIKFIKADVSYLRFDYREGKRKTWLHVRGERQYY